MTEAASVFLDEPCPLWVKSRHVRCKRPCVEPPPFSQSRYRARGGGDAQSTYRTCRLTKPLPVVGHAGPVHCKLVR